MIIQHTAKIFTTACDLTITAFVYIKKKDSSVEVTGHDLDDWQFPLIGAAIILLFQTLLYTSVGSDVAFCVTFIHSEWKGTYLDSADTV